MILQSFLYYLQFLFFFFFFFEQNSSLTPLKMHHARVYLFNIDIDERNISLDNNNFTVSTRYLTLYRVIVNVRCRLEQICQFEQMDNYLNTIKDTHIDNKPVKFNNLHGDCVTFFFFFNKVEIFRITNYVHLLSLKVKYINNTSDGSKIDRLQNEAPFK